MVDPIPNDDPDITDHHPCGPSRQGQIAACAGSVRMSAGLPQFNTEYADKGRLMHERIRQLILTGTFSVDHLSDAEVAAIWRCWRWLEPLIKGAKIIFTEDRVILRDSNGIVINWGWLDFLAIWDPESISTGVVGKMALLVDWKFYRSTPEPEFFLRQTGNYAGAVLQDHHDIGHLECYAYNPYGNLKYHSSFSQDSIPGIVREVKANNGRTDDPEAPLSPSFAACQYCRGIVRCEAAQSRMVDLAAFFPQPDRAAVIARLTKVERRKILDNIGLAREAKFQAETILDFARDLLRQGHDCEDFEIEERAGNRRINDTLAARDALVCEGGLTSAEFIDCMRPSVTALEKTWKDKFSKLEGTTKRFQEKIFATQTDGIVSRDKPKFLIQPKRRRIGHA